MSFSKTIERQGTNWPKITVGILDWYKIHFLQLLSIQNSVEKVLKKFQIFHEFSWNYFEQTNIYGVSLSCQMSFQYRNYILPGDSFVAFIANTSVLFFSVQEKLKICFTQIWMQTSDILNTLISLTSIIPRVYICAYINMLPNYSAENVIASSTSSAANSLSYHKNTS